MAYRVNWSPRALMDVEELANFIEKDSLFYAQAVVTRIVRSTAKLADFPLVGRIVPEFNQPDFRELFVYSYRVIYQVKNETVTVVAIIHGKRLLLPG
jgi:addiction module RelE/StbE family toxin